MKIVKVAKLGEVVKEVAIADDANMEEVLDAAGVDSEGFDVRVNGRTPCGNIVNGDMITLVPAVKGGGEITVKVAKLGEVVKEVLLPVGANLEDALEAADVDSDGFDVRVNGSKEDLDYSLGNGAMITLVPAVKGGR